MQSLNSRLFFFYLWLGKLFSGKNKHNLEKRRQIMDSVKLDKRLEGTFTLDKVSAKGTMCYWLHPEKSDKNRVILYLHGGGYNAGSFYSHQNLITWLGKLSKSQILFPEYLLAPEYPFPAALDSVLNAYEWLLKNYPEKEIIIAGDSAGGGLAMAMTLTIIEEKIHSPKALYLLAPWTDLSLSEPDIEKFKWKDPTLTKESLAQCAKQYASSNDLKLKYISPYFGDYAGFPPTLIQIGTRDLLLPECRTIKSKMDEKGISCELNVWPGMVHVWQLQTARLPEAISALQKGANFIEKHFQA